MRVDSLTYHTEIERCPLCHTLCDSYDYDLMGNAVFLCDYCQITFDELGNWYVL